MDAKEYFAKNEFGIAGGKLVDECTYSFLYKDGSLFEAIEVDINDIYDREYFEDTIHYAFNDYFTEYSISVTNEAWEEFEPHLKRLLSKAVIRAFKKGEEIE